MHTGLLCISLNLIAGPSLSLSLSPHPLFDQTAQLRRSSIMTSIISSSAIVLLGLIVILLTSSLAVAERRLGTGENDGGNDKPNEWDDINYVGKKMTKAHAAKVAGVAASEAAGTSIGASVSEAASIGTASVMQTQTEICVDDPAGWVDIEGDGCAWYEYYDPTCDEFGDFPGPEDITANDACCTCGGGITCINDPPGTCGCVTDPPGWVDQYGDTCLFYELFDNDTCSRYGDDGMSEQGIKAKEACCTCGGGKSGGSGSKSSKSATTGGSKSKRAKGSSTGKSKSKSNGENCVDDPLRWEDSFGDGCPWYEIYDECETAEDYPDQQGITANDACCFCGGGIAD